MQYIDLDVGRTGKGWQPCNQESPMLICPLLQSERDAFRAHMLRLDAETRRLRFFRPVNDLWIGAYLDTYAWKRSGISVAFCEGALCGSAEIIASDGQPSEAEFAIAVESTYRRRGIGKQLLAAALLRARNRGVRQLTITSLPETSRSGRCSRHIGRPAASSTASAKPPWRCSRWIWPRCWRTGSRRALRCCIITR